MADEQPRRSVPDGASEPYAAQDLVADRYRLTSHFFETSRTIWWRADDTTETGETGEDAYGPVALKLLKRSRVANKASMESFGQEAKSAQRLTGAHIASVRSLLPAPGTGIVMDSAPTQTLREALASQRSHSISEALSIIRPVAAAVDAAQGEQVTHGNLRPELIWQMDDEWIVAGFGTNEVSLRDMYLSPERAEGGRPSVAADVYALAAITYELLSGYRPDRSSGTPARLHHQAAVDWPVADVVMEGLDPSPRRRPASAVAFVEQLEAALGESATHARTHESILGRSGGSLVGRLARLGKARSRLVLGAVGVVAFVVVLGLAASAIFGGNDDSADASETKADADATSLAESAGASQSDVGDPGTDLANGSAPDESLTIRLEPAAATPIPPTPVPATATEVPPTVTPTATPWPVPSISSATAYDPAPGSGDEHDELAPLVFDGIAGTEWRTEVYRAQDYGNTKRGVGIFVELSEPTAIDTINVRSRTNGWIANVYISDSGHPTLAEWGDPVGQLIANDAGPEQIVSTSFDLVNGAAALIWIIQPGPLDGGFGLAIDEIGLTATQP